MCSYASGVRSFTRFNSIEASLRNDLRGVSNLMSASNCGAGFTVSLTGGGATAVLLALLLFVLVFLVVVLFVFFLAAGAWACTVPIAKAITINNALNLITRFFIAKNLRL